MSNIKLTDLTELTTVSYANTILLATDLAVSPNVSHYVKLGTLTATDYATANAAFAKANTAYSVGFNANAALILATTANTTASTAVQRGGDTITGVVRAPTAVVDSNSTQLATTAFVINQGYLKSSLATSTYAPLASPSLTGQPVTPTAATATSNTMIASTAFVKNQSYLTTALASSTYQPIIGFTPLEQGGGIGQLANKLHIGWTGSRVGLQVDATNYSYNWPIDISGVSKNTSSNGYGTRTVQPISSGIPINSVGSDGDIIYQY